MPILASSFYWLFTLNSLSELMFPTLQLAKLLKINVGLGNVDKVFLERLSWDYSGVKRTH